MARPAIRTFRRSFVEQHAIASYNNAGHALRFSGLCFDQPIAVKSRTTTSWRELHSESQEYHKEAGPSNPKRDVNQEISHLSLRIRSQKEAQVNSLRREVVHPEPRPNSIGQMLRNIFESEQVWPLRSNGLQPKEITKILDFLNERQLKEGRWQRLEFLRHIEFIHDGIRNCYHKVRKKAKSKIEREYSSSQIYLSDEEAEVQTSSQIDVRIWLSLLKSRSLKELLSSCRQISSRIPSISDVHDVLEALGNDPSVPGYKSKYEKSKYENLLQDINRALPPYKRLESAIAIELLDETKIEEFAINWKELNEHQERMRIGESRTFSDISKFNKDQKLSKPLGPVRMFEEVWRELQTYMDPTPSCYRSALSMEIKLATWRSAKVGKLAEATQDEFDQEGKGALDLVWKPVSGLLQDLHARNVLQIDLINHVMWNTVRFDPNHSFPNFDQYDWLAERSSAKFVWPSLDNVSAVYEIMRNQLLQKERDLAAMQSGSLQQLTKYDILPAKLLGNLVLDDLLIPDAWTYNLMLRFYSSRGDLKSVLQVVQDMDNTTIGTGEEHPKISMITFGTIFDAFAKHGEPSRLVHFDREAPERSKWTFDENAKDYDKYYWNMDKFELFFERFLQLQPAEASQLGRNEVETKDAKSHADETELAITHQPTLLDRVTSQIRKQMANPAAEKIALAPSSQQQFYIITALRRVSGDEPEWVISQFVRLAAKFATYSADTWDANGSPLNDEGWTRFRMTNRIERILEMLYELRDSDDIQRKGIDWQTKFRQEMKARLVG